MRSIQGSVRVLAVDPGLTRCGIAVVEGDRHRRVALVGTRLVRTDARAQLSERLREVYQRVTLMIEEYGPDRVAVEQVFAQRNLNTALATAQAAGVVMLAGSQHGLPVATHTPSEVKAAVTGTGRADKAQVTTMVQRLLRLAEPPRPADVADALALAISHLWRSPLPPARSTLAAGGSHA